MHASGVRDIRDDLPLWSMIESRYLQYLKRDDEVETGLRKKSRMMEKCDRQGLRLRDGDHGALGMWKRFDSRVRLAMVRSGTVQCGAEELTRQTDR
jgi:hypothetical protein